jgi:hypothetical protein
MIKDNYIFIILIVLFIAYMASSYFFVKNDLDIIDRGYNQTIDLSPVQR